MAEATELGDIELVMRAVNNSLLPGQGISDLAGARAAIDTGQRLVERYGLERFGAKLAAAEAYLAVLEGDADAAEAALSRPVQARAPLDVCFLKAVQAFVLAEPTEVDAASSLIVELRDELDPVESEGTQLDLALAEASLAAAKGDAELAERALDRASRSVGQVSVGSGAPWWDVAICALEAGVAPEVVARHRQAHHPPEVRRHRRAIAHLDGLLHLAAGDEAAARHQLGAAAEGERLDRPMAFTAQAGASLAELTAAGGDLDDARRLAGVAGDRLERWPGRRREAVRDLQLRLGSAERPPHELLTRREQEVCRLLAQGCSNREIADRLFISAKTVSVHVSNILAKLGLERRAQVAA
jgi:DNA-binding CsgD family transcriptional regulator